jgi:hypothetical protein
LSPPGGSAATANGGHASVTWSAALVGSPALAVDDISGDGTIAAGDASGLSIDPDYDKATGALTVSVGDAAAWLAAQPTGAAAGDGATLTFTVRLTATFTLGPQYCIGKVSRQGVGLAAALPPRAACGREKPLIQRPNEYA